VKVLDEVDFELLPGEVHVLAGENGAGKSTLIKIAGGVYADYEGSIEIDGRPARFRSPREELIRRMLGRETVHRGQERKVPCGTVRLEARNLSRPPLREISFQVRRGEVVGLWGLQGAGCSELLHTLFGSYGRDDALSGEIRIDGILLRPGSPRRSIRQGMAFLTNDRKGTGLVLGMSVLHNASLATLPQFSPGGWLRPHRERTVCGGQIRRLDVRCRSLDQSIATLSGGNQQKVALAKWLQSEPKVLLLDEPTRGIDVGSKYEIYRLIEGWTEAGMAVVLTTSELPELLMLSDRILVMHRGRCSAEFGRSEANQEKILHAAMQIS
jgi:ABC-type sugar transport system ATPase subunit